MLDFTFGQPSVNKILPAYNYMQSLPTIHLRKHIYSLDLILKWLLNMNKFLLFIYMYLDIYYMHRYHKNVHYIFIPLS